MGGRAPRASLTCGGMEERPSAPASSGRWRCSQAWTSRAGGMLRSALRRFRGSEPGSPSARPPSAADSGRLCPPALPGGGAAHLPTLRTCPPAHLPHPGGGAAHLRARRRASPAEPRIFFPPHQPLACYRKRNHFYLFFYIDFF